MQIRIRNRVLYDYLLIKVCTVSIFQPKRSGWTVSMSEYMPEGCDCWAPWRVRPGGRVQNKFSKIVQKKYGRKFAKNENSDFCLKSPPDCDGSSALAVAPKSFLLGVNSVLPHPTSKKKLNRAVLRIRKFLGLPDPDPTNASDSGSCSFRQSNKK